MNGWHRRASAVVLGMFAFFLAGCGTSEAPFEPSPETMTPASVPQIAVTDEFPMSVQREPWGETADGQPIEQFHLLNRNGISVSISTYGAAVTAVHVPDRDGNRENIVLGFDSADKYLANGPYFGVICGRYANRIAKGRFQIGDQDYTLATNNGPNHLHGGKRGFDKVVWMAEPIDTSGFVGVKLVYVSRDGEEGYPGKLTATVVYTLNNEDELQIEYTATTDKPTPVNLTNHCYWNLGGANPDSSNILDHVLTLHADRYLPVDETGIPTGELAPVAGTPMDFTKPQPIGARIGDVGNGYDHCYVINSGGGTEPVLAAELRDPETGRVLQIATTTPGVQLYTGNHLDGSEATGGFGKHQGVCLECQHFPDSPNQPEFPNTILQPGEVYRQITVHKFLVEE